MKDDVNKDVVLREPNGRWAKGTPSPSPGRPQGSRSQFSNEMLADMRASWAKNGPAAMQRTFEEQPAVYFRTMASIIPKDVALTVADALGAPPCSLTISLEVFDSSNITHVYLHTVVAPSPSTRDGQVSR